MIATDPELIFLKFTFTLPHHLEMGLAVESYFRS